MAKKKCVQSLEKILPLLDLTTKKNEEDSHLILYTGDISSITVGNFRSLAALKIPIIKREYKKHIPECDECKKTYLDFLESLEGYKDIEKANTQYLNIENLLD
tara:strand:- start:240 stop:548 length:309 start_codon:yes stop_codon:yes gene_type:complete